MQDKFTRGVWTWETAVEHKCSHLSLLLAKADLWQLLVRPLIHFMNKLWNVTEACLELCKDVEGLSLPFTHWWAGWTACLNVMDVILIHHTWKLMNSLRASCRDYKDTPWIKCTIEILPNSLNFKSIIPLKPVAACLLQELTIPPATQTEG